MSKILKAAAVAAVSCFLVTAASAQQQGMGGMAGQKGVGFPPIRLGENVV